MSTRQGTLADNDRAHKAALHQLVTDRFAKTISVSETLFATESARISDACWSMARRFHQGGRLIAFGNGTSASDAQHVSVEFVHPVIVGKRALPVLTLTNDSSLISGLSIGHCDGVPFAHLLSVLGRPQDIALGFSTTGQDANVFTALTAAHQMGMLTLGLTGGSEPEIAQRDLDFRFNIPTADAMVVQETHETLYHVLWELVHIFFEHEGLLR